MNKIKLIANDFDVIKNILSMNDNTQVEMVQPSDSRIILMNDDCSTELCVTSYAPDVLVVQRVVVKNQRKGTFSTILEKLKYIAKINGFKQIMVQSVMTEAMANFCLKNNFKARIFDNKIAKINNAIALYCDYILEVS